MGIRLKRGALSGNNREWACTKEMSIASMSHCVVNVEVAEALVRLVQAVSRREPERCKDDKALIPGKRVLGSEITM